ncbi:MAG: flagellar export protein FliJ [Clostridiales bacterium]|nr:flagellar export protein FliJ [Clostridiales bacterium]
MRKFQFTLETLERAKEAEREQQEAELAKMQKALDTLLDQMARLKAGLTDHQRELGRQMDRGLSGMKACVYDNYATYLRETMEQLNKRIAQATAERDAKRAALLQTMRELQALNKLRARQYGKYLEELRREEEKSIGDFVSYQVTSA